MAEKEPIECRNCGMKQGEIGMVDGHEGLIIGGLMVNNVRGVCLNCGTEFDWSLSERALARLIKKALDNRAR